MIKIPSHIDALQSYKPGKAVKNVFEGKGLKKTAILSSNENNLGCSSKAIAAMQAAAQNIYLYPDPGSMDVKEILAKKINQKPENIVLANGSDGILSLIFKTFFEPGDEVLSSEATFVAVEMYTKLNQIPFIKVPMAEGYRFDMETLTTKITDKTKAVYLSNPNNPTGAMITKAELESFMAKVPKNVLVIVDEAYFEYSGMLSDEYPDSLGYGWENVLTLRTFSKAYGLAGLRVGYGIGNPQLIDALSKVKLTFDPNFMAQVAAAVALQDEAFLQKTVDHNQKGLAYFYKEFEKLGLNYVPSFGNFVMIDFGTEERAMEIFQTLFDRGVFIRPLKFFGLPHCVRISVGTMAECELCVEKLKEVLG
ncbi:histidinol-phosphate transaminase [Flammeovirgaceae bacterium SG7u.111]|nr:histidinol-phosphate transaminase [Flammeovirgaceae bacterium SG7u.132]WPO35199.1 histidinol-phosphate transaminase [Flammeovirgaceae bacterium SG7u.111]